MHPGSRGVPRLDMPDGILVSTRLCRRDGNRTGAIGERLSPFRLYRGHPAAPHPALHPAPSTCCQAPQVTARWFENLAPSPLARVQSMPACGAPAPRQRHSLCCARFREPYPSSVVCSQRKIRDMRRCSHCQAQLGLVVHRKSTLRFCSKACKKAYEHKAEEQRRAKLRHLDFLFPQSVYSAEPSK